MSRITNASGTLRSRRCVSCFCLIAWLLNAVLSLSSCGEEPEPVIPVDWSQYTLVVTFPEIGIYAEESLNKLVDTMTEKNGSKPQISYDTHESVEYEILLGCDRNEVNEISCTLRSSDYVISFTGTKFIIATGKGNYTLSEAIDAFINQVLNSDKDIEPGELIRYECEYQYASLKINGTPISEYSIVYSYYGNSSLYYVYQSEKEVRSSPHGALWLRCYIYSLTGYMLKIIPSSKYNPEECEHAFLFGDCGYLSEGITAGDSVYSYTVRTDGNCVAFAVNDLWPGGCATLSYFSSLIPEPEGLSESYDVSLESCSYTAEIRPGEKLSDGADTRIFTYCGDLLSKLVPKYWYYSLMYTYFPDVICFQGAGSAQYKTELTKKSGNYYYLHIYDWYDLAGTGPNFICFRRTRYEILADGVMYLNDSKVSSAFGSWAVADDKESWYKVIVCSICLPKDEESRIQDISILLDTVAQLKTEYGDETRVIIAGNCNVSESDPSLSKLFSAFPDITAIIKANGQNKGESETDVSGTGPVANIYTSSDISAISEFSVYSDINSADAAIVSDLFMGKIK